MNPFRKIKEHDDAVELLRIAGYRGTLGEMLIDVLAQSEQMHDALAQYNQIAGDIGDTSGSGHKTYFVPFAFESSQYHNGGHRHMGTGWAEISVAGGVRGKDQIASVSEFISKNLLEPNGQPNASVTPMGFTELPA